MLSLLALATLAYVGSTQHRRRVLDTSTGWDTSGGKEGNDGDGSFNWVKGVVSCQKGMINMWYGEEDDLPYGWKVCDGTMSTPDLRGRFALGADGSWLNKGDKGGNRYIRLTVDQLPEHSHNIWQKDMTVTEAGWHTHSASGTAKLNGRHKHGIDITSTKNGGHGHSTSGMTDLQGSHGHDWQFWATKNGSHNHRMWFDSKEAGAHSHGDTFYVKKGGSHKHTVWVTVNPGGSHKHDLDIQPFDIEIPNHQHDVGSYAADDHVYTHSHKVKGNTSEVDDHSHPINIWTKWEGKHDHDFEGTTMDNGQHRHGPGSYVTDKRGDHLHSIDELMTDPIGNHTHQVPAYFECRTWDHEGCEFGLAADWVSKPNPDQWVHTEETLDEEAEDQLVPAHNTSIDGEHMHNILGQSSDAGIHNHAFKGKTSENGYHRHQIVDNTDANGGHYHSVYGKTDEVSVTLKHLLSGMSGAAGYFKVTITPKGMTDSADNHTHTARAHTDASDNHTHALKGNVLSVGNHSHVIDGDTDDVDDHTHNIMGKIDPNGNHKHSVTGYAADVEGHTHDVKGASDYVDGHEHELTIKIENDGRHTHKVSGVTGKTGGGNYIDITPPYVAVWYICCIDERPGTWQTPKPWDNVPPPPVDWQTTEAVTTSAKWEDEYDGDVDTMSNPQ